MKDNILKSRTREIGDLINDLAALAGNQTLIIETNVQFFIFYMAFWYMVSFC